MIEASLRDLKKKITICCNLSKHHLNLTHIEKALAYLAFSIEVQRNTQKEEEIRFDFSAHIRELSCHFTLQRKINHSQKILMSRGRGKQPKIKTRRLVKGTHSVFHHFNVVTQSIMEASGGKSEPREHEVRNSVKKLQQENSKGSMFQRCTSTLNKGFQTKLSNFKIIFYSLKS